ncbi:MAG: hypothetical protein HZB25_11225 [Candidatus Eisenbacteria bacterium]|nr:hypothetical protein [Candidatus Eisenbacteria bacterium]
MSPPARLAPMFPLAGSAALLALTITAAGPAPVRMAVALVALWVLPGWSLARLSGRREREPAPALAYAFGGSAAWLALAAALCFLLRLPPAAIAHLTAGLLALSGAWMLRPRARGPGDDGAAGAPGPVWNLAQSVALVGLGAFLLRCGGSIGQSYDSLDHLAYMKTILQDGSVLPLREFYREVTSGAIDLRKGFLHGPLAVTAALGGESPAGLWRAWPALAGPAVTACFYVLARTVATSRAGAAAATVLFALLYGAPGHSFLLKLGYPNKTADALVWLAFAGLIAGLRAAASRGSAALGAGAPPGGGERPEAGAADPDPGPFPVPWLLAASAMVHVFAPAPWFFVVGVFVAVAAATGSMRTHARSALRSLAVAALCCVPILAWRFLVSYDPVNPMHTRLQGLLVLPAGYVLEPLSWLRILGQATWLSLLATPFFLAHRPSPQRLLACVGVWSAVGLLFNPLLMPLVAPKLGYLAVRLYSPALALCVLGAWLADQAAEFRPGRRVASAGAWLLAAALLLGPDIKAGALGYGPAALAVEEAHSSAPWRATLEFLERAYPDRRVVVSDAITCYSVAGLTRHDVIATLNQHSSPSDREALERMQAASDILSPGCPPARAVELLRRYGVDLVVLNFTHPGPRLDYMVSVDPAEYPAVERKFASRPDAFREVFRAPGQRVFEVLPAGLAAYAAEPVPAWPDLAPPAGSPQVDLGGGNLLGWLRLEPRAVAGGESVFVRCLLRRDRPPRAGERFRVELSLAREVPARPAWLPPRLGRVFAQKRAHRLYRLNYYLPLRAEGGLPEHWPAGRWVRWAPPLYVPGGAEPGRYLLRMRAVTQDFLPSVNLRHYLEDDDATPGGVLDSVQVLPPDARGGRRTDG